MIACAAAADEKNQYAACFARIIRDSGNVSRFHDRPGALSGGIEPENEYVIYIRAQKSLSFGKTRDGGPRAVLKAPGDMFCSHRYTPSAKARRIPPHANGGAMLFSHPRFAIPRHRAGLGEANRENAGESSWATGSSRTTAPPR